MTDLPARTEAEAVADIVKEHIKPQPVGLDSYDEGGGQHHAIALPKGLVLHSLKPLEDERRTAPERRKGHAKLTDLASFIAHANRFKDKDSAIFADPTPGAPKLVSVLDYHPPTSARFGEHRGVYAFPLSEEWQAWTSRNRTPMSQGDFAEWVEGRIVDLADPAGAGPTAKALADAIQCTFASPSRLLELSRGLQVHVGEKVHQAVNLATGEAAVQFVATHQDAQGAPLRVPGGFLVAMPVFRSGALYQVAARLRYRVKEGNITWFYELYRTDRVFDDAFREACETATRETGLPLFQGTPE